jgi:hypothetical protein
MKLNRIRYGMIVLLIGSVALTAGRANAQRRHDTEIQIDSYSWGISPGEVARIAVTNQMNQITSFQDASGIYTVNARIQLLDTEGEVVAQSDEISVEPNKIRFWDVSYEQISGVREPNGRLQLRARILFESRSFDRDQPPLLSLEIFDSSTGATRVIYNHSGFIALLPYVEH